MKIAICDDELLWREQLANQLEDYFQSLDVLMQKFSSGEDILQEFEKGKFDLIFLDIEMKGKDGFQTAKQMKDIQPDIIIIFLTSHTDLAMDGYEVQAFRFLAKPIVKEKLYAALQAFEELQFRDKRLSIMENGTQKFIKCKEIRYIKSENVYLQVEMEQEQYWIRRKLKEVLEDLPQELFVLVHRSYIVNLKYVRGFEGNEIILDDETRIPVSKGKKELFRQQIMRYMKEKG